MNAHRARPYVLIQYNCIAHYRARIFELLSLRPDVEFVVVADPNPDTPFLATIKGGDERQIRHVCATTKIIRIPKLPELYWQPLAVKMMRRERPDVLIALGSPYSVTAWVLSIYGRALKIPVLLWGHGLLGEETGPKWWLRKMLYRLASGQLLYGDYAKTLLVKKGFDPETLHVVYNSLDYDLQSKIAAEIREEESLAWRHSLGVADGEGLVVFTGRLQPVKRLDMLVEAIAKLARRGKRVHAALVGEGSQKSNLVALSEQLGVADLIHFLGASYDERYLGLVLSASDLSVIPSGAGLSIMHAMIFGTPVVLHDRVEYHFPEWEAVEEGKTGFYYKYGDIDDLAKKIERAIFPSPKRAFMKEACKRVIDERYNPHRQVGVFIDAVKKSLAQYRKH